MKFSQLEQFQATLAHESHENFLFYAGFTPDLQQRFSEYLKLKLGEQIGERLGMFMPVNVTPTPLDKPDKNDLEERFGKYFEDVEQPEGSYINDLGVLNTPGSMYHFTHYISPLRNSTSMQEIENFKYYPGYGGFDVSHMTEQVQMAHAMGRVTVCFVGHMYEDAWQIRGYEAFLADMLLNPEHCEYILDKVTERNMFFAEAAAKAGVDFIRTGDDVANQNNMMFSHKVWQKFIKTRWAKV